MTHNILVTGAAGFMGSFLCEELVKHHYKVVGIDNFFRGNSANLKELSHNKQFNLIEMDLSDSKKTDQIKKILKQYHVTVIFHLAAINGTKYFYDKPEFVLDQNIKIIQNLIIGMQDSQVNYVIYTSSSEVYGEPFVLPTDEKHPIVSNVVPRDSYGISKAICEFYLKFSKQKFKSLILRVFNTYGPRMVNTAYGHVIPEFIHRMLSKDKFTIIGDGSQTRSFCYINDSVWAMRNLMEHEETGIVNLGFNEEITILDLAKLIHQIHNKPFHSTFLPDRPNDHKRRCPDITKLKRLLPEIKFTNLIDGLKATIDFYKKT